MLKSGDSMIQKFTKCALHPGGNNDPCKASIKPVLDNRSYKLIPAMRILWTLSTSSNEITAKLHKETPYTYLNMWYELQKTSIPRPARTLKPRFYHFSHNQRIITQERTVSSHVDSLNELYFLVSKPTYEPTHSFANLCQAEKLYIMSVSHKQRCSLNQSYMYLRWYPDIEHTYRRQ